MSPCSGTDPDNQDSSGSVLADRKVIIALSGGIACYKSAVLVSLLSQRGAAVRVLMTEAATKFITPLTFQSLSGRPVLTSIWQCDDQPQSQHIGLAHWCELLVIAPASADLMAKIAAGLNSDIVSLVASALPQTTPVLLAPAMNAEMWKNPITQRNLQTLKQVLGYEFVGPDTGWQACRTSGPGRMSDPEVTLQAIERILYSSTSNHQSTPRLAAES